MHSQTHRSSVCLNTACLLGGLLFTGLLSSGASVAQVNDNFVSVAQADNTVLAQNITNDATQEKSSARMFGEQLFQGNFASTYGETFTDDYFIKSGDTIQIRLWGAYQYMATVTVDANGYITLPNMTPLKIAGISNRQLTDVVDNAVKNTYRSKVGVYASLEVAQPVKVFVTGFVNAPGYYSGLASDSVLAYLDRARGVDPKRGSYIDIQVNRQGKLVKQVNLYDFLLAGQRQPFMFKEGDIIKVAQQHNTFRIDGAVRNDYVFEYSVPELTMSDVLTIANPTADASQIRLSRQSGTESVTYSLLESQNIPIQNGDYIFVISNQ